MTDQEHDIDLSAALSRLRTDVRRTVAQPAAAQLRHRADRRLRIRRTATVLVAAGLVGAALVGGGLIWNGAAPKPPPVPGVSPSPSLSGTPSASPRPSRSVPARQTPQVPAVWSGVQWATATITFPANRDCPSGPVTFRTQAFKGSDAAIIGPTTWPRVTLQPDPVTYGDVTGDGRPEAFIHATCWLTEEDSGDGQGQLLAVRRDGTTLRAIAWVGPRGGLYDDRWVDAGRLYVDVKPHYTDWGYRLGAARAYRWTGQAFTEEDSGYPGMVPAVGATAPAVDLTPVAGLTGCPSATLRFDAEGRATSTGTTWDLFQPSGPDSEQHLADLSGDGRRLLLVSITCGRDAADPGHGFLAVLDGRADGSFVALDALQAPAGTHITGWQHTNGTLTLRFAPTNGEEQERHYTWNGDYFQP
ncbi:hypothetical protein OHA72_41880 [Dactylosporangium sp. NBC_01737]|uniref:hypothetical protein n=1 Tax=Dactylosporangium sp. NBC_01737 TaxID=2975959 RepID=UPI002E0E1856|nr:hypothetical protein OHA72_41880 [Dactylosporangium sp. NBC_01737]